MSSFIGSVRLFVDGACRGNPGPGAIALIIEDENETVLESYKECIGQTTNNRAEYRALIAGLDRCAKHTRKKVVCFMDSELVVNQMNKKWRLKNDNLRELFHAVMDKQRAFNEVIYQHQKRENPKIKKVDRLAKEALEGK